ncbi:MAG: DUF1801 domain-containing protein [Candidatus Saccharimonadales bacterium]
MAGHTDNKTQPTDVTIDTFLQSVANSERQADARVLCQLYNGITGNPPVMWGSSIIGFDTCHYKYPSGREGDMGAAGFSPRAANMTIYLVDGVSRYTDQLKDLGPHTTGKACLYIKRLSDINIDVLKTIIAASYQYAVAHKDNMGRAE